MPTFVLYNKEYYDNENNFKFRSPKNNRFEFSNSKINYFKIN